MGLFKLLLISSGALELAGCATVSQAQIQCTAFGFTPGTSEHADCVQQQYQANRAEFQQRFLNASRIANAGNEPTYGGSADGTGFLKTSYVSGMNRICVYNRMGSAYVLTIGAAEMCPLTSP